MNGIKLNIRRVMIAMGAIAVIVGESCCKNDCITYDDAIYRAAELYHSDAIRHHSFSDPDSRTSSLESGRLCYYLTAIYNEPQIQSIQHVERRQKECETQALLWATQCGRADIMRYLLHFHHPDMDVKDECGRDLMTTAVYMNDNVECLRVLQEAGLDVHGASSSLTPLYEACHMSRMKCMNYLLQHGAQINARCQATGETSLDGALLWAQVDAAYRVRERTGIDCPSEYVETGSIARMAHRVRQMGGKLSKELDPEHGVEYPKEILDALDMGVDEIEAAIINQP